MDRGGGRSDARLIGERGGGGGGGKDIHHIR